MTAEETICFKLLDEYSRTHYAYYLAELFLIGNDYTVCFRPAGVKRGSSNRYACRYLKIGADELATAARNRTLSALIAEMLDSQLSTLPQQ
jgi:hypothetical protein